MLAEIAPVSTSRKLATDILSLVMRYRRVPAKSESCSHGACPKCLAPYLDRVIAAIERREPVMFVLPAFPGKSPNPAKVLGTRPDMAERQSLDFLNNLSRKIQSIYAPGAQIVLCSDGRVFNDAVGIADEDITTYQHDLNELISEMNIETITTFNLDNILSGLSFDEMRTVLMRDYGQSVESVRDDVQSNDEARRMYLGITRFLFEDGLRPDMKISKTALQKDCRRRAYEVIQRSRAWDVLLAMHFPDAVRLSIHPQICGSRKIGIHLMDTQDEWLTAWHSVAVEVDGRFRLMKRAQAETLGAELVTVNGRASHFVLTQTLVQARCG